MRVFRSFAYFVVGCLLGAWAVFAHAETVPATLVTAPKTTPIYSSYLVPNQKFYSASEVCTALCATAGAGYTACHVYTPATTATRFLCEYTWANSLQYGEGLITTGCPQGYNDDNGTCKKYTCPAGATGPALVGGVQTCTLPAPCPMYPGDASTPSAQPSSCSCPAGTKWAPYSGCRKTCGTAGADANAGFDINIQKGASEGCFGGCVVQHKSGTFYTFKDGSTSAPATYTGWACEGNGAGTKPTADGQPTPDSPKLKDTDKHQPKCGSGEGVITSSSGNVLCVPPGTPNTSTPKVETQKKTETYSDSSAKTTETTKTTDPYTSATHTSTTTTTTANSAGTAGQAGAVGTATSSESNASNISGTGTASDGKGTGDKCEGNDCGGGKPFPETGELWKKKYPDGISGVLNQKFTAIKSSSLGGLVGQLAPNLPNSGACPSWSFSMNLGQRMNFGGATLSMPCAVWSFVRIVLLITSALVARRLIFGG